jgi:ABC-type polysaccharide/polyol phosphate transport system ATPase subunit
MAAPAVEVHGVSKSFRLYQERNQSLKAAILRGKRASYDEFWALRGVSFEVPEGATFGLVGNNGSGKSTLLKCIARILLPDRGSVRTHGSVASLLELGSGFHQELSGRENIYLNGSMLRMTRSDIDAKLDSIIDFAGIGAFIDQPVKNYSSGMYVRLGFAVAINVDPDVLLVDEVLAVGDANFQDKCMQKFEDFHRVGKTIVIASHALGYMRSMCDEVGQLERGRLVEVRGTGALLADELDPRGADGIEYEDDPPANPAAAHIVKVEVLDRAGFPALWVHSGDEIAIRVHYLAVEPVPRPVFALGLDTASGICAWAQHSRDAPLMPKQISGTGSIEVRIPRLALQSGSYDLHASLLNDAMTHTYDDRQQCSRLEVSNDSLNESVGVAVLGGKWGSSIRHDELEYPGEDSV